MKKSFLVALLPALLLLLSQTASARCLRDGVSPAQLDQIAAEYSNASAAINAEREAGMNNTSDMAADEKNAEVLRVMQRAEAAQAAAYANYLAQYNALTKECGIAAGK